VAPFGEVPPGRTADARIPDLPVSATGALAFPTDALGNTLLRPWLDSLVRTTAGLGTEPAGDPPQRFLLCVLRSEGTPVAPDARLSSRSQTVTLLYVAEGP
jgi:hypothetical protein